MVFILLNFLVSLLQVACMTVFVDHTIGGFVQFEKLGCTALDPCPGFCFSYFAAF